MKNLIKLKDRKSKLAQLKIQQTAFMLVAVFIFFVLAGVFFVSISMQGARRDVVRSEMEKAIATAANIADTAEFACGKSVCIDADKLILLSTDASVQDFKTLWPVAGISVRKVSPLSGQEMEEDIECTKVNYPECNVFNVYNNEDVKKAGSASSFVALCRKENKEGFVYEKCEIAKIDIIYRAAE